jgi:hypothetical protein
MLTSAKASQFARIGRLRSIVRRGPLEGRWLFLYALIAQFGHLIEHIAKQLTGAGLLGPAFDSELSHILFNTVIAAIALVLLVIHPRNPWVYPLCVLSVIHGLEHVYIFEQYLRTGAVDGPGLLGQGGAFGIIPIPRIELHNIYNGLEMILIALGFSYETEVMLERSS